MSEEINKEVAPSQEQPKTPETTSTELEKNIEVEMYGVKLDLPISKAKELIAKRDEKTQGYKQLQEKVAKAEGQAKAEADRANLLQLMKSGEAEQVEEQVASKYKDTIAKFEKRVYEGEIKATLSKLGVIGDAIPDATKLVLSDAKAELDGDDIKLNGVKAEDYLKDWTSKKPHLVVSKGATPTGAKQGPGTKVAPKAPVNPFTSLTKGLMKLGEQQK